MILTSQLKEQLETIFWINFEIFFFEDFIYLFMRDTERERERDIERETEAEGEAGSMQGA